MPLLSKERLQAVSRAVVQAMLARPLVQPSSLRYGRGGWNAHDLATLDPEQWAVAQNVHLDSEERVAVRDGHTAWGSNAIGAPSVPTSLHQYVKADGTNMTLASASNGSLWKDAGSGGSWSSIGTGLASGVDVLGRWATFANLATFCNGSSNVKKYDGTTLADLTGVPAAVQGANNLIAFGGRLWLMKGSQANYSEVSDPNTWPTNNFLSVDLNNGEDLNGAARIFTQLFFGKPSRWYAVLGNSTQTMGWVDRPGPGPVAIDSVRGDGSVVYYLADDGIYKFNGANPPERISKTLDSYIKTLSTSRLQYARAVFDPLLREYWLAVSESGQSQHNVCLVLNVDTGSWWKYALGRNCFASIRSSGQRMLLAGDSAPSGGSLGKVWRQNDGTTDNGTAIAWQLDSPLSYPAHEGAVIPTVAQLALKDLSGTLTLTPLYKAGAVSAAARTVSLDGAATPHKAVVGVAGQGELQSLRLSGSGPMTLTSYQEWAALTRSKT